jgi:hypothetical protein
VKSGRAPAGKRVRFHPKHARRGALPALHAERFYGILGRERSSDEVARLLRSYVQAEKAPVVGAMRVSCSDEAEQESIEAFQRQFVRYLLPSLKFSSRSPFRVANLGGRYEWGSVRIAEDHYALAEGAEDWKLLVVKINAHVAVQDEPSGRTYGRAQRYGAQSTYCGALHAVLDGHVAPFARSLEEDFSFEGVDRLSILRDPHRVDPALRGFHAAVVSARVQARRAMIDVQDHTPLMPTLYLILPTVTLNRAGHDTEIVCGIYTADRRGGEPHDEYCGVGDDAGKYRLGEEGGRLVLEDPYVPTPRRARDHRDLVRSAWTAREGGAEHREGELREALTRAKDSSRTKAVAGAALKAVVAAAVATSPVPAAVLLFGEGLVRIHHASQAHRLAKEAEGDEVAREMLAEVGSRIDELSPEEAQHLVTLLTQAYGA